MACRLALLIKMSSNELECWLLPKWAYDAECVSTETDPRSCILSQAQTGLEYEVSI